MNAAHVDTPSLRGARCTDPLDTSDAADAYGDLQETTGDPVAAAILVAALLLAEALREAR